ncbi:mannose-1-phosphate guanyltransferase [Sporichthya polymorpha]|uniref:mannose-1-phosphate guanyltransferase n=1 Tax=Sporichthya polymorpha TaxID=35751 RepID=UPI00035D5CB5|nr:mannose-1-phosphate guanyltransferase [Sporichthya polymorpha]
MKAVVMAGGEGTRLRPITASMPKPLLPVVNRPVMEHVLRHLRHHGFTDVVVTVQFLASLVRNYFGDGEELGMAITYATEEVPMGTAGSVKNAEDALRDDTFLVISGDALTDVDLSEVIRFHREREAMVTVCLTRVANPLDFGITILDENGRVERFLEKPSWGQVFSDTVNTGIYVMEPSVFEYVPVDEPSDWSGDIFPLLLKEGLPVYGFVADGYWEDVGTHENYLKVQADVLSNAVETADKDGFEIRPGIWICEGAEVDPSVELRPPLYIGDYAKVEAGATLREYTVIGSNVVVKSGAFLDRAVIHDNVYIGPGTNLRACVVGKNTDVMRGARVDQGVVVGDHCLIGEEAIIAAGVKIYPSKTIDAGAVVNQNVIWEARGQRALFGPRGVSGIVNVEITPEHAVRLASSYATTLKKGDTVLTARDGSRAARALKQSVISALQAAAINVRDLEMQPPPVARLEATRGHAGGVLIRTTPGIPDSVDIQFIDATGADLSAAHRRRVERVFSRQEYRRAFPGEIGDLTFPGRVVEHYVKQVLNTVDTTGVPHRDDTPDMKVVVDAGNGAAGLLLPRVVGGLGVDVLTVNMGIDEARPTQTPEDKARSLARLGELVASSKAAFGVYFDPLGERISLVDERGIPVADDRALLVVMDLIAAERRGGRIALPVTTTRVAEKVAGFHGVEIAWTATSSDDLARAVTDPRLILGGDGRGGFVIPEVGNAVDGTAAFVRLVGLIARTQLTLSQIDARIPRAHVDYRVLPTPWALKGKVMRAVVEAAGHRTIDTTDGVRVVQRDGSWIMVLPDPSEATTHLWAEADNDVAAATLAEEWCQVVERAAT